MSDRKAENAALPLTTAFVVENEYAARFRLLGDSFAAMRAEPSSLKCAMRARSAAIISCIEAVESEFQWTRLKGSASGFPATGEVDTTLSESAPRTKARRVDEWNIAEVVCEKFEGVERV